MELKNQVTSLELSRKLAALGVPQKSLFWHYQDKIPTNHNDHEYWPGMKQEQMRWRISFGPNPSELSTSRVFQVYAAFTVAELGEIFDKVMEVNLMKAYGHVMNVPGTSFITARGLQYCMQNPDIGAAMLIYLLENKLITL